MARCVSTQLRLPCRPGLLRRTREGVRKTHLGLAQRASSVRSLYFCPQDVLGRHIAVVDDVLTTGSTLHSIALTLKAAGAATVTGLVRSEEHTSELQSLMRISYAVICLKKKKKQHTSN